MHLLMIINVPGFLWSFTSRYYEVSLQVVTAATKCVIGVIWQCGADIGNHRAAWLDAFCPASSPHHSSGHSAAQVKKEKNLGLIFRKAFKPNDHNTSYHFMNYDLQSLFLSHGYAHYSKRAIFVSKIQFLVILTNWKFCTRRYSWMLFPKIELWIKHYSLEQCEVLRKNGELSRFSLCIRKTKTQSGENLERINLACHFASISKWSV